MNIEIRPVKTDEESLKKAAIKLGDENSKTLGHIRFERWDDYFRKEELIVALESKSQELIGFLAYYPAKTKDRVRLDCLCIAQNYRGMGVAQRLNDHLVELVKSDYSEIRLRCRTDYKLDGFWKSLGYHPIHEQDGKAVRETSTLMNWKKDLGHVNLFNFRKTDSVDILLDTLSFQKVCESVLQDKNTDFKVLLDPQYSSEEGIQLCILQEHLIEISRSNIPREQKNLILSDVDRIFRVLEVPGRKNIIKSLLQTEKIAQSDRLEEMIGTCISYGISFLSSDMLDNSATLIERNFGIKVIKPSDLLQDISRKIRAYYYNPCSVTRAFSIKHISVVEVRKIEELIYSTSDNKMSTLIEEVLFLCSNSNRYSVKGVFDQDGSLLAYIAWDNESKIDFEICHFFCVNSSLGLTTAQYLMSDAIKQAISFDFKFTRIRKSSSFQSFVRLIEDNLFFYKSTWIRAHLSGCMKIEELRLLSESLAIESEDYNFCELVSRPLLTSDIKDDILSLATLEKVFWPIKLIDANFSHYVIPIEPKWAKELFDEELASQILFGNDKDLLFKSESVYYKSKFGATPQANSRILWYVSGSKSASQKFSYVKSIRACSIVSEVIRGTPEVLFQKYQYLGIYSLNDLQSLAGKQSEIVAIRFAYTELFEKPVNIQEIQEILQNKATFTSTLQIQKDSFLKIYRKGQKI